MAALWVSCKNYDQLLVLVTYLQQLKIINDYQAADKNNKIVPFSTTQEKFDESIKIPKVFHKPKWVDWLLRPASVKRK